jgi:nitric oxide reductase subunit C
MDTVRKLPERDNRVNLTEQVAHGKKLWEDNNCLGCHTLLGEGAYFAPELGNVFYRRGGEEGFNAFFKSWMKAQPLGIEGRRAMPQFHLTDEELDALAAFLEYAAQINTNDWPPNIEG